MGRTKAVELRAPAYTLEQVDAAEARIKRECPRAFMSKNDFGWELIARRADRTADYVVFWHNDLGLCMLGDVDAIIAALKS